MLKNICTLYLYIVKYVTRMSSIIGMICLFFLLLEYNGRNFSLELDRGDKLAQLARLDITLNDGHPPISLHGSGNQGTVLADGEVAREASSARHLLQALQGARLGINGKVDERVRDNGGAVGLVKVGNLQGALVAGRDD